MVRTHTLTQAESDTVVFCRGVAIVSLVLSVALVVLVTLAQYPIEDEHLEVLPYFLAFGCGPWSVVLWCAGVWQAVRHRLILGPITVVSLVLAPATWWWAWEITPL